MRATGLSRVVVYNRRLPVESRPAWPLAVIEVPRGGAVLVLAVSALAASSPSTWLAVVYRSTLTHCTIAD